jgi:peptide/nickel transport system substrate-binding protein
LPTNYYHYSNPEMDLALGELKTAADGEQEQVAIEQIQRIWNDTVPGAILAAYEEDVIHHDDIKGLIGTRSSIIRFDKAFIQQ